MQGKPDAASASRRILRAIAQRRVVAGLLVGTLVVLASAAIVAPFYYSNLSGAPGSVRHAHDLTIHLSVMQQFDKLLRAGIVYPRWLPDANDGYGNAWPNFYQPGFYYLTSLVHLFARDWVATLFVITALGLAASAFAFYRLARLFFGKPASATGAVLYALLPYHLLDFCWRGALPEYLSFVLLPLILYFFYRLGGASRLQDYAGLGLCYGLCLIIHVPISYLFSLLLVFYTLVWAAAARDWRIAGRIAVAMAVGVLLSSIYWLPAAVEIKYAVETVTQLFKYRDAYITLLPGDEGYDPLMRQTFALQSLAFLILAAVWGWLRWCAAASLAAEPQAKGGTKFSHTWAWIILGSLAIFMNLPASDYLARLIPKIEIVAFPWRWLVFVCLFTALLAVAVVERLSDPTSRSAGGVWPYRAAWTMVVVVVAANLWFAGDAVLVGSLDSPAVTPAANFLVDSYCPKGVPAAASLPRTEPLVVQSKTASVKLIRWEPLDRQAVITTNEATTARFKTFNFPGWAARLDGAEVPLASDAVGAQLVALPPGSHTIEVRFAGTSAHRLGAALSICGLLLLAGLALAGHLRRDQAREGAAIDLQPRRDAALTLSGAEPEPTVPRLRAMIRRFAAWGSAGLMMAGMIFFLALLIKEWLPPEKTASPVARPQRTALRIGADVKLAAGGGGVVAATNQQVLSEVIDAMARHDEPRMAALLQSGQAFSVEPDTRARLLSLSSGTARVLILEGNQATKEGWVPEGWLK
ncbi:MAG TPA: 6-pyruvoyl-tetrahydropterin synthase-related protein [Blastocatellia bacterium]|nr:6-pyruvoyl-tetrahydropterin synthase-related protein [Blastocatellia bacterium]